VHPVNVLPYAGTCGNTSVWAVEPGSLGCSGGGSPRSDDRPGCSRRVCSCPDVTTAHAPYCATVRTPLPSSSRGRGTRRWTRGRPDRSCWPSLRKRSGTVRSLHQTRNALFARVGQPPWPALPIGPTFTEEPPSSVTGSVAAPGQLRVTVFVSSGGVTSSFAIRTVTTVGRPPFNHGDHFNWDEGNGSSIGSVRVLRVETGFADRGTGWPLVYPFPFHLSTGLGRFG
jgi:hypothetical protein